MSLCEECRHCRWETSGNGWDEPRESIPSFCTMGHEDIFDSVEEYEECEDYDGDLEEDEGPDPMDAYKQKIEDDMVDRMEGRW